MIVMTLLLLLTLFLLDGLNPHVVDIRDDLAAGVARRDAHSKARVNLREVDDVWQYNRIDNHRLGDAGVDALAENGPAVQNNVKLKNRESVRGADAICRDSQAGKKGGLCDATARHPWRYPDDDTRLIKSSVAACGKTASCCRIAVGEIAEIRDCAVAGRGRVRVDCLPADYRTGGNDARSEP